MKFGPIRTALVFALVSLALVVTGANFASHQDALRHLSEERLERSQQVLGASYPSRGVEITLRTPRLLDEDLLDWICRHRDALAASRCDFPVGGE